MSHSSQDQQIKETHTGVLFPHVFSNSLLEIPKQELLCLGVRTRKFLPWTAVNVYAIGVYCEGEAITQLKAFANNPAHDPEMILGEFLKYPCAKTLRLVLVRDVDSATLLSALIAVCGKFTKLNLSPKFGDEGDGQLIDGPMLSLMFDVVQYSGSLSTHSKKNRCSLPKRGILRSIPRIFHSFAYYQMWNRDHILLDSSRATYLLC